LLASGVSKAIAARLDIQINDHFAHPVVPREWFLLPLFVIDAVVAKIKDGSFTVSVIALFLQCFLTLFS